MRNFIAAQFYITLDNETLIWKALAMENNWAVENLQTIRTLMERSALYRRALAPVMFLVGGIGLIFGILGAFIVKSSLEFVLWWFAAGIIAIVGTLLLVRKQALKDEESFWSAPTKRVVYSLCPSLFAGILAGISVIFSEKEHAISISVLPALWIVFYGIALNSAGFFMQRGMKLFGLLLTILGSLMIAIYPLWNFAPNFESSNAIMGAFFGIIHLAYGVYLHFTEKQSETK
ncbi:MAG: hypothetical protein N2487_03090 [Verrucomicrobiae bacterium]|nr:hypothetical protein [Verrucomicrobiae bacterium]